MTDTDQNVETVFTGGAWGMDGLTMSAVQAQLLAAGVGVYGHVNGVFDAVVNGQMATIAADYAAAAPGVAELGFDTGVADGTVTIENTGSTQETVAVGSIFETAGGLTYQLMADPGQPGVTSLGQVGTDGYVSGGATSDGEYVLASGASETLAVEALGYGTGYDLPADTIATLAGGDGGIKVSASSATTGGDVWTDPSEDGILGATATTNEFLSSAGGDIDTLFAAQGYNPSEANVNVDDGNGAWTTLDLESWKGFVDNARAHGVMNLAPIFTDNSLNGDYSTSFATSAYFADARAAALYSGGLAMDTPPWFFDAFTPAWFPQFGEAADTYVDFVEQQVKWATSEGLRTSIIVSPDTGAFPNGQDPGFMSQAKAMVARLQADGAMPSQFVVENYSTDGNTFSASDPDSLNAVAAYLASLSLTSTTSESGLETAGRPAADVIMTGIVEDSSISGTATPYATADVAARDPAESLSMTVSLSNGGVLVAASGVSADGLAYTVTGTASRIQAALDALKVSDLSASASPAILAVSISDAEGTVSGRTAVSFSATPGSVRAASPASTGSAPTSATATATSASTASGPSASTPSTIAAAPPTIPAVGAPPPIYGRNADGSNYYVWNDASATATIDATAHVGPVTVYGGGAALDYTGAHTVVVLNGPTDTGPATIRASGDGDQVWAGASRLDYVVGGSGQIILGATPDVASSVTVTGGSSADAMNIDVWGAPGVTQAITNTGSSSADVFGGGSDMVYTGGHSVIVSNGPGQTGSLSVTSTGNDTVWAGAGAVDFREAVTGDDALLVGQGPIVVHGAQGAASGTTDIVGFTGSGSVDYLGGAKSADIGIQDGSDTVSAGSGTENVTLSGKGSATVISAPASSGVQNVTVASGSAGSLNYQGGGASADIVLGGGSAMVTAGSGNMTLTGGSGSLTLNLDGAAGFAASIDGATGGGADVFGFNPATARFDVSNVRESFMSVGGFVLDLADGRTVTFHGLTSHDGITLG